MPKALLLCVFAMLFALTTSSEAQAQKRIATVIGNSNYETISRLRNPERDASLLAERLRGLRFDVRVHNNVDRLSLRQHIVEHGDRLKAEGRSAVGFFFYAGHAMEVGGVNYLLPTDFPAFATRQTVGEYAVSADLIATVIEDANTSLGFIVLDACRDDPLGGTRSSGGGGLAAMQIPGGTLIAYSTAPGKVALDGQGQNSPYVTGLYRALGIGGLTVAQVFIHTRTYVLAETGSRQRPWENTSLTEEFVFNAAPLDRAAIERERIQQERMLWDSIKDSTNPTDFEAYLQTYPRGAFVTLARPKMEEALRRLSELREQRLAGGAPPSQNPVGWSPPAFTDFWAPSATRIAPAKGAGAPARQLANLGVVLQSETAAEGTLKVVVAEVKSASPFFGKVAVGDVVLAVNHRPLESDEGLAFLLSETFNQFRRVDLSVQRGQSRYTYGYRAQN